MDVVTKIEGYGSDSGKTSKKIVIADCGQLWWYGVNLCTYNNIVTQLYNWIITDLNKKITLILIVSFVW